MLRAAVSLVCFVQQQAVRLSVVRIAGSARCGRRALVEQLRRDEDEAVATSGGGGGAAVQAIHRHLKELGAG